MHPTLEIAQDRFTEGVGKLAESVGLNKFIAQLYAVLYLSDKPLSLDDIVVKLKVSKGNISLNIRELENWGMVRNVWVKGSRKDYYEVDPDIKKAVSNKLKLSLKKRIDEASGMLDEFKKMIESSESHFSDDDKKIIKGYQAKLKKIEDLKSLVTKAMAIADKFF